MRALTLFSLLAVALIGTADAHTGGSSEVRIAAQRLGDGRVEFALQVREGSEWGQRILPSRRFFPATGSGRWLTSSPLNLSVASDNEAQLNYLEARGRFLYVYAVSLLLEGYVALDTALVDAIPETPSRSAGPGMRSVGDRFTRFALTIYGLPDSAPACDRFRGWLGLAAEKRALSAGWWALIFEQWPSGDYFDEQREASDAASEAWQASMAAWRECSQLIQAR